jgi:hypothetical protein
VRDPADHLDRARTDAQTRVDLLANPNARNRIVLPQFVSLVAELIRAGGGSPNKFIELAGVVTVIVGSLHKLLKGEWVQARVEYPLRVEV